MGWGVQVQWITELICQSNKYTDFSQHTDVSAKVNVLIKSCYTRCVNVSHYKRYNYLQLKSEHIGSHRRCTTLKQTNAKFDKRKCLEMPVCLPVQHIVGFPCFGGWNTPKTDWWPETFSMIVIPELSRLISPHYAKRRRACRSLHNGTFFGKKSDGRGEAKHRRSWDGLRRRARGCSACLTLSVDIRVRSDSINNSTWSILILNCVYLRLSLQCKFKMPYIWDWVIWLWDKST